MSNRPVVARTVFPRKAHSHNLPMIVVTPDMAFSDHTGTFGTIEQFLEDEHPRAMVVCMNTAHTLLALHEIYKDHPRWNFRVTPVKREHYRGDGTFAEYDDYVINYFGFKGTGKNSGRSRKYYYPISPTQFSRTAINAMVPGDQPLVTKLYEWGQSVRSFVIENDLRFSPTAGGLAAQLLRDSKFYPLPRRKVPMATNENTRKALPGNYYELRAVPKRVYGSAYYIDQRSAHHYAAENVLLPHADNLRAYGRFEELDGEKWLDSDLPGFHELLEEYGLYHLRVHVPKSVSMKRYVPPYAGRPGDRTVFVFSNEIKTLTELGIQVRWISAAWTSPIRDTGLTRYAVWAQQQVTKRKADQQWLKPTLLAAYGILAAKPKHLEVAFLKAESGEPKHIYIGAERLDLTGKTARKKMQSPVANVLHRGLIEAETRQTSLNTARELEAEGHEVLCVYADAVIVKDTKQQLPLMPEPWRIKDRLTWVAFHDSQSFESNLLRRMPGSRRYDIMAEQSR